MSDIHQVFSHSGRRRMAPQAFLTTYQVIESVAKDMPVRASTVGKELECPPFINNAGPKLRVPNHANRAINSDMGNQEGTQRRTKRTSKDHTGYRKDATQNRSASSTTQSLVTASSRARKVHNAVRAR